MAVNYGLLEPVDIAGQFMAGRQQAQQNQLAQQQLTANKQQMETGALQQEKARLDLEDYKTKQAGLDKFVQLSAANGKTGSPEEMASSFYEFALGQKDPQLIMTAQQMVQAANERKKYDTYQQRQRTIPAQQAPASMAGGLGTGTFGLDNVPGMPNALAPQAAAPMAAADPVAAIDAQIAQIRNFADPRAKDELTRLEKRRDELTKLYSVGGNLVSATGKSLFTSPAAPTDVKKLMMERDALPPGSPNRAIYDQQIKDLGATAQNARDRLAFDQQKFNWEKSNPGHELIQNADGEYYAVDKRTKAMTPLMVGGSAPAAAAPMGGGQGARGVPGVAPAGGVPVGRTAAPAGVPFVGKSAALTESQSNAALFGSGMAQAQNVLTQASKKGVDTAPVTTSIVQGIVKYVPFGVGDKLVQDVMSVAQQDPTKLFGPDVEQQKVGQAQLAFTIAYLRKTSGAAFGQSELVNTMNEFFPSVGEDKAVTTQKAKARERVVEGMKLGAGSQGAKFIKQYQGEDTGGAASSSNDPLGLR